jgi:hypothetical protein
MSTPVEEKKNNIPAEPAVAGPASVPGPAASSDASAAASASPAAAPGNEKTLQDYMKDMEQNKILIEKQQYLIAAQLSQGQEVLNTLKNASTFTQTKGNKAVVANTAVSANTAVTNTPGVSVSHQEKRLQIKSPEEIAADEEAAAEEKKRLEIETERKKGRAWFSSSVKNKTPEDARKKKEELKKKQDEYNRRFEQAEQDKIDFENYKHTLDDETLNKYETSKLGLGLGDGYKEYKEKKQKYDDAVETLKLRDKKDMHDNTIKGLREKRNQLEEEKYNLNQEMKQNESEIENLNKSIISITQTASKNKVSISADDQANIQNMKKKIQELKDAITKGKENIIKKDEEVKKADGELSAAKKAAVNDKVGGKTRKRRTKNLKRRQSRKYRGVKA